MQVDHEHLQQSIIGSLLLWPDEIDAVAAILSTEDFYQEKYRIVYDHLLKKDGGDFVTVSHALAGKVEASDLLTWMGNEVTSAFLPRYCHDLKEFANKIRLMEVTADARKNFNDLTLSDMLEKIESVVTKMDQGSSAEPTGAPELVMDAVRRLKVRRENRGQIQGLPYGFPDLDAVTDGMHGGELIIVAGRPSMGKSAFVGNILDSVCASGKSGLFFSLEMDKGNQMDRMLSARGNIDFGRMRSGMLSDVEFVKLTHASEQFKAMSMRIDDTPAISMREIRLKAKKQAKSKDGLHLLLIDYLQLMRMPKADSRALAVGEVSRGLKQLARELNIPVILLSQLNRGLESRNDKRPMMSDLRDSGEIEQDADVILFPFRPSAYCQKCKDKYDGPDHSLADCQMTAEIIVEKQRNGERNLSIPVIWLGHYQKFASMARETPAF